MIATMLDTVVNSSRHVTCSGFFVLCLAAHLASLGNFSISRVLRIGVAGLALVHSLPGDPLEPRVLKTSADDSQVYVLSMDPPLNPEVSA